MNLKNLSDKNLLSQTKTLAAKEREITTQVIKYLAEVDRRKLYAELGFSSLFSYCREELKMSEGQAHRRIQAARLLHEIPEVDKKIEEGLLGLSALSQIIPHFKDKNLNTDEKKNILDLMEGKGKNEVDKLIQDLWGEEKVPPKDNIKPVSKTQHQITVTIDEETLEILKELKATMAPKGVKDLGGVIKELCKLSKTEKPIVPRERKSKLDPSAPTSRTIPTAIKRQVYARAKDRCEFTFAGKVGAQQICGSKFGLNIDHVKPYSQGGTHELSNLRLLCHAHHARESFKVFGNYSRKGQHVKKQTHRMPNFR